jgi:hypothetical protein
LDTHVYLLFKLFSLRPKTDDYIAFIESVERLYSKGIITRFQVQLLNDYLAGYTIAEMTIKNHIDVLPYLEALCRILSHSIGYTDHWFIQRLPTHQKRKAETELRRITFDYIQEVA